MTDETHADLIACEDALMFVNAAITSTGQREFHHDADRQRLSLDFLHAYMLANYREVYAAALALDINDHTTASRKRCSWNASRPSSPVWNACACRQARASTKPIPYAPTYGRCR